MSVIVLAASRWRAYATQHTSMGYSVHGAGGVFPEGPQLIDDASMTEQLARCLLTRSYGIGTCIPVYCLMIAFVVAEYNEDTIILTAVTAVGHDSLISAPQ